MALYSDLKTRLRGGEFIIGTWVAFVQTPGIIRMIAEAGFDFCAIDLQHSALSIDVVGAMCDMARASGITPVVRPALALQAEVNRLQDAGAVGIMFPDVRSRTPVDIYRSWLLYPPAGERGVASATSGSDYYPGRGSEALQRSNAQTILAVQVEHVDGIAGLDSILAGGGVDLLEVGRHDLATSMGLPGALQHPAVQDAVREIVACCERYDVPAGTAVQDVQEAQALKEVGVRSVLVNTDRSILSQFYRATCGALGAP